MEHLFEGEGLKIDGLRRGYEDGSLDLESLVQTATRRMETRSGNPIWIHRVPAERLSARIAELNGLRRRTGGLRDYPLWGVPYAVKDNIDVEGLPTTAACPGFAYTPVRSARAVERLEAAGAILVGKTNMDQFATGLTGTRSPYGIVRNAVDPEYIAGGSSSGSAVAVSAGLVSFALGTDTAGSGRIPAGFNGVVGFKPSRGLVSARGVVPACRSLDCVSVFAQSCGDAFRVLEQCRGGDPEDAFSREAPAERSAAGLPFGAQTKRPFTFGVPDASHLEFFGDAEYSELYRQARHRLEGMGGRCVEIPFAPFAEAARLLYQGPWLAERRVAFGDFIDAHPAEVLPVIRAVMARADSLSAADGFRAYYRLRELRGICAEAFKGVDALVVPTAGTHYTVAQVEADPVALNTNLGYYTNFVNLLDLCALSVPAGFRRDKLPFGVTFIAPAFREADLVSLGEAFEGRMGASVTPSDSQYVARERLSPPRGPGEVRPMRTATSPLSGATEAAGGTANPGAAPVYPQLLGASNIEAPPFARLAVLGLHLSGQPLNGQLLELGARLAGDFNSAPCYRLYAIRRGERVFPGLLRLPEGGEGHSGFSIALEVWEMTPQALGLFLRNVREPLCVGTVELENGEKVKGFLCEAHAAQGGEDITRFGGWRTYLAAI